MFRCISDDPLGVGGDRGRVVALKVTVSALFRFVSDDPLGVGGRSRRWRPHRDVKTGSFGTISIRRVFAMPKVMTLTVDAVSWHQNS